MDIPVEALQGMLDKAWLAAPADANSLRDQLVGYEQAALNLISGGSLASVSKNSASQSWMAGPNALTPLQVQKAWRKLINLFDSTKMEVDAEIAAGDSQSPGNDMDPVIYQRMQLQLFEVTEYTGDMSDLLLPPVLNAIPVASQ